MPLPIIQSLPHGGLSVPAELASRLAIDATTIYNECDLWVNDLFDFAHPDLADLWPADIGPGTAGRVTMPIARVLVDANRPPNSLDNPDGAIKTITSYGSPVYRQPLTSDEQRDLLQRYWQPYHQTLEQTIRHTATSIHLFLDCHNMAQLGPAAYAHPGAARPLICLANFGDTDGEPLPNGQAVTCPPTIMRRAAQIAQEFFADLSLLQPAGALPPVVALNYPFPGGYILRHYHARLQAMTERSLPAIMIEVNRGLFVGNQTTDTAIAPMNEAAVGAIRRRLYQWALALLAELE